MVIDLVSYIPAMISGAMFVIGGYHFTLYLRKDHNKQYLSVALFAIVVGIFLFSNDGIYASKEIADIIFWQNVNSVSQSLSVLTYLLLVQYLTQSLPKTWVGFIATGFAALIILQIINPQGLFWNTEIITTRLNSHFFLFETYGSSPSPGPLLDLINYLSMAVGVFATYGTWNYYRKTSFKEASILIVSVVLLLVGGVFDILKFKEILTAQPFLLESVFPVVVILVANRYSIELIETSISLEKLEDRNEELETSQLALEELVELRTGEFHRQQEYFQTLFDHSPLAVVSLNSEEKIVAANTAFCDLFGYNIQELFGKNLDQMIATPELLATASRATEDVSQGKTIRLTTYRLTKSGDLIPVEVHGVPIIVDAEMQGALAIYRDISEQQGLEILLLPMKFSCS